MRRAMFLAVFVFSACASGGLRRVDDASLVGATVEQQTELDRRSAAHEDAKIALKDSERTLAEASLVLDSREHLRDAIESDADANQALRKQAKRLALDSRLRDYEAQSANLRLRLEEANRHVQLARAQEEYADAQVRLRKAELMLADAEWEEAKAATLEATRPEQTGGVKLSDFKAQVAGAHEEVASAQDRSARAWKKVEDRRKKHEVALTQLPTTSDAERRLILAERDKGQLEGRIQRLEKRIRDLERENASLMTRLTTSTGTTAAAR